MELNRNQYMMIGLVMLAMGIQFRRVESFVLNEQATAIIAKQIKREPDVATTFVPSFGSAPPPAKRVIKPPRWLGWMLLSAGGVLMLYSLAMPKPGG